MVTVFFVLIQALKEALTEVRFCSRAEELLLKKKSIAPGDSMAIHSQKVLLGFMFKSFFDIVSPHLNRIPSNANKY